jgi:glucose-1-phosphate thymidylyltransferase
MKGIILAGGSGTRLYPMTKVVSKQLLPVYDKPMIYYPLSVLLLAGIREILIITTPQDSHLFQGLLSDGSQLGVTFSYAVQEKPEGLAQAFLIGEEFIGNDSVCLILGDNIFYGQGFSPILKRSAEKNQGATIFGYQVRNPKQFGVASIDSEGKVTAIHEKPEKPESPWAVTGLYMYDSKVTSYAKTLTPSKRGELEITDLNNCYLRENALELTPLGRGFAWLDTGTQEGLLQASQFVATIEARVGMKIACIEEIAYRMGYIGKEKLLMQADEYGSSSYGDYMRELAAL